VAASMNDIKARMKSVKSTMQITKAMELVATSKLRRAKEKAEATRPFYELLTETISSVMTTSELNPNPWCEIKEPGRTLFVVIAGDRGLAGGYNSNIFKLTERLSRDTDPVILPIGKKALEYFTHRKYKIFSDALARTASVGVGDTLSVGAMLAGAYKTGEFDRVTLVYTRFVSMLTQSPVYEQLLPLEREPGVSCGMEIDGDGEEMLASIVPAYLGGVIYSALTEAIASESGARRTAMSSANKNASEMIDTLMLKFNRARQAVITQEITEIVSGAEAL